MIKRLLLLLACLCWPIAASAQTYTITPTPFQTALDNNGVIISGACIWTFTAGTSTAATTYSDNAGTPNANPIKADTAGRFTAFLVTGSSYKFQYESSCTAPTHGTILRTADNIAAMPAASANLDITGTAGATITAGQAVYLSDGSGGKIAGEWYPADASATYSSILNALGVAPSAIASGSSGIIRMAGQATNLSGLTPGVLYYVGTTGAFTTSLPGNTRLVGEAATTTAITMLANPPPFVLSPNGLPTLNAADGQLLIGRTSDNKMVLGSLTAGAGMSITTSSGGITLSSGTFAGSSTAATDPSGTANTGGLMMGLAGAITPTATGKVLFCMAGTLANDTSPDGAFAQLRFGTGAAPVNGAALTGTAIGSIEVLSLVATNAQRGPFGGCVLRTGLTVNTAAWFDISLGALTGGIATATSVVLTAAELP